MKIQAAYGKAAVFCLLLAALFYLGHVEMNRWRAGSARSEAFFKELAPGDYYAERWYGVLVYCGEYRSYARTSAVRIVVERRDSGAATEQDEFVGPDGRALSRCRPGETVRRHLFFFERTSLQYQGMSWAEFFGSS